LKAGIQYTPHCFAAHFRREYWIPSFEGMTATQKTDARSHASDAYPCAPEEERT